MGYLALQTQSLLYVPICMGGVFISCGQWGRFGHPPDVTLTAAALGQLQLFIHQSPVCSHLFPHSVQKPGALN